jgi:chromosomal replication initiation ATPase DnaA
MTEIVWSTILDHLRATIDPDEYRRWFLGSSQASDSGDQITVWIPSAAHGRHISTHYLDAILRELERLGRGDAAVRFVATGYGEEDEDEWDE